MRIEDQLRRAADALRSYDVDVRTFTYRRDHLRQVHVFLLNGERHEVGESEAADWHSPPVYVLVARLAKPFIERERVVREEYQEPHLLTL